MKCLTAVKPAGKMRQLHAVRSLETKGPGLDMTMWLGEDEVNAALTSSEDQLERNWYLWRGVLAQTVILEVS